MQRSTMTGEEHHSTMIREERIKHNRYAGWTYPWPPFMCRCMTVAETRRVWRRWRREARRASNHAG
jgi:hypothetical protein